MPRLRALTPREVIRVLEQHGFVQDRQTGSHVVFIHPERGRRAVVPVHRGDLPRGTLLAILKTAGIDTAEVE